jgi:hypothetical protein
VFLVGGITFVAETAVTSWIWGALSAHAALGADTARVLLDVASFWGPVLTGSAVTMLAPVVVAAVRGDLDLPRWLTVLGVVALVEQVVETITVFGHTGFTAPGGPMNLYLGALLTLAWFAGLGITLARRDTGTGTPRVDVEARASTVGRRGVGLRRPARRPWESARRRVADRVDRGGCRRSRGGPLGGGGRRISSQPASGRGR